MIINLKGMICSTTMMTAVLQIIFNLKHRSLFIVNKIVKTFINSV